MTPELETVQLDGDAVWAAANAEQAPIAGLEAPEATQVPPEAPRDEAGRFAKQDEQAPAPEAIQPAQGEDEKGQVPSFRLREVSEKNRALEERLARLERENEVYRKSMEKRPAPEPEIAPDEFEDFGGAVLHNIKPVLAPIEDRVARAIETFSKAQAETQHGKETLDKATSAFSQWLKSDDPVAHESYQALKQSEHPFGDIVGWYQQNEHILDPGSVEKRQQEKFLNDPAFRAVAEKAWGVRPAVQPASFDLPPNINRARGSSSQPSQSIEMSGAEIWKSANS